MQNQDPPRKSFKDDVLLPSLKFGAVTGAFGLILGTVSGILRSRTPVLFATVSGFQCFAIGTTYWNARMGLLNTRVFHPTSSDEPIPSTYIKASSAAGGITGSAMGLLFRGPRNILPGAIMFSLFGYGGQRAYDFLDQRHTRQVAYEQEQREAKDEKLGLWGRSLEWLADPKRKWSPLTKLSDKEYEDMLQEKLIGVEADLAMIDEEIAKIQREKGGKKNDSDTRGR